MDQVHVRTSEMHRLFDLPKTGEADAAVLLARAARRRR